MIPHTIVLEPGLIVFKIYNGYWFFGRPTVEELRQDLRAVLKKCRPDWDITSPEMKAAWARGEKDRFYPYGKSLAKVFRSRSSSGADSGTFLRLECREAWPTCASRKRTKACDTSGGLETTIRLPLEVIPDTRASLARGSDGVSRPSGVARSMSEDDLSWPELAAVRDSAIWRVVVSRLIAREGDACPDLREARFKETTAWVGFWQRSLRLVGTWLMLAGKASRRNISQTSVREQCRRSIQVFVQLGPGRVRIQGSSTVRLAAPASS